MKALILALVLVFALAGPCQALDIHGEVALQSSTQTIGYLYGQIQTPLLLEVTLWTPISTHFVVGVELECLVGPGITYDGWLPKLAPLGQYYGVYLEWRPSDVIYIRLTDECRHYFGQSLPVGRSSDCWRRAWKGSCGRRE